MKLRPLSCERWPPARSGGQLWAGYLIHSGTVSTRLETWVSFVSLLNILFLFQEYFQSSAYPEGLNGSSYYGQLPVQQAHSTTPHEAPHSVSVTTGPGAGAGPGAGLPPSGPPISLAPGGLPAPIVRDLPIRAPADIPKSIGSLAEH